MFRLENAKDTLLFPIEPPSLQPSVFHTLTGRSYRLYIVGSSSVSQCSACFPEYFIYHWKPEPEV